MRRFCLACSFVLVWLSAAPFALAGSGDTIFESDFEPPFDFVESDAEAARFLNQGSFGATSLSIAQIRTSGIQNWIAQQSGLAPTLSRPFLEGLVPGFNNGGASLSQTHRVQRWLDVAVTAPDQLRQRVAWALGQIVVVSDQDAGLNDHPVMMAEWNDLLVRNALGNFGTLLRETLRSPMMGRYLTHLRNRKFEMTPMCKDQRASPGLSPVSCTGNSATNSGTLPPIIVQYNLPTNGLIAPDENFAREIMQLFTIGLIERDPDFSPVPDAVTPNPTYNQTTVTTLSRVLTGLSYACSGTRNVAGQSIVRNCACSGSDCSFATSNFFNTPPSLTINDEDGLVHPDRYEPMICYPRYHDDGRDRDGFQYPGNPIAGGAPVNPAGATIELLAGQSIPGGTPPSIKALKLIALGDADPAALSLPEIDAGQPRILPGQPSPTTDCEALTPASASASKTECLNYCDNDLSLAVDLLFNHPNTATMIARQLIQRLVGSNPSPDYIERVAGVFANNGAGVRGDLRAVVTAVLMDPEARQPIALGDVDAGKPREPLLKLVQLWRSFGAISGDTGANGYRRWARLSAPCGNSTWPQCAYLQRPLGAPSVFNFYEPDFQVPGNIADLGLYSPELQIVNESSAILAANDLYYHLCIGRGTGNNHNCHAALRSPAPVDSAYFPDAVLDALPGGNCGTTCTPSDDAALIGEIDLRLLGGSMSGALGDLANPGNLVANTGMRGSLLRLLQTGLIGTFGETLAQNTRRREILYLLHLVAISPEYATQR